MDKIETVSDLEALKALLAAADLPISDIGASQTFFGIYSGPTLVAAIGLEWAGSAGLLRSLVVSTAHQKQGLARRLVRHAEGHAAAKGVTTLYLLTTTAQPFFERLGFVSTSRASAPPSIASTAQFAGLCPASAAFLNKAIDGFKSISPADAGAIATGASSQYASNSGPR